MRCVASKFVPRLLSVDQKQQRLDVCLTSKKMPLTTPAFFRMSLRVTKPGFTPTARKPKLNPVNGKVRGNLDRKRQGKWETTSSQCLFVSLIRRELFTKNLFLLVKQLILCCGRWSLATGCLGVACSSGLGVCKGSLPPRIKLMLSLVCNEWSPFEYTWEKFR